MRSFDRRGFLKISSAGLAGLTLSGLNIAFSGPKRAFGTVSDTAWKFGVMADTQWKTGRGAVDPASCATTIIDALNDQFLQHGCKFVIQVGDLVDREQNEFTHERFLPTRAAHASALYDNGIGFFPVRGNHEASAAAAMEMTVLFPQTRGQGKHLFGATNFKSPKLSGDYSASNSLQGLTYMFDYNNVRCVLIDQFTRSDGSNYNGDRKYHNNAVDQVEWVDSVLSANSPDRHAFVFAHKNLIGQSRKDNLFGRALTDNAEARDSFLNSLFNNNVQYYVSGHDHMHHYSIVRSGDAPSSVGQIICSSNSYKFYTPRWNNDGRETPIEQELYTIGYYIFTVDGPRVTVDFYSSSHGLDYGDVNLTAPPTDFAFCLRDTFGYSLNGNRFEVAQGESFTKVNDTYHKTRVQILSGVNSNGKTDLLGRPLSKIVNTGWSDSDSVDGAASKILSLWGMADNLSLYDSKLTGLLPDRNESKDTDTYTLSMTSKRPEKHPHQMKNNLCLAARDGVNWVNAVDLNTGGTRTFVDGPWKPRYELGTWGADPGSGSVWAVINHDGDFVIKPS
ncbi:MAG TPA: metallophosphoesterase [Desulfobacterales bacterium]|nr:metallophosphoesterase [Desulfobacterales bacterium]